LVGQSVLEKKSTNQQTYIRNYISLHIVLPCYVTRFFEVSIGQTPRYDGQQRRPVAHSHSPWPSADKGIINLMRTPTSRWPGAKSWLGVTWRSLDDRLKTDCRLLKGFLMTCGSQGQPDFRCITVPTFQMGLCPVLWLLRKSLNPNTSVGTVIWGFRFLVMLIVRNQLCEFQQIWLSTLILANMTVSQNEFIYRYHSRRALASSLS